MKSSEFYQDMNRLQQQIKQLEREYEQWFSGALPRPPVETQQAVERLIRKYNVNPPRSLAEQSVFQMHQSKYNTYSEMWNRRIRLKEEGRLPWQQEAPARRQPPAAAAKPVAGEGDRMRQVYEQYLAAKKKAGEATGKLTYEKFRKALDRQAEQLRSQRGYRDVDFRVAVKDGKISVVARPKK